MLIRDTELTTLVDLTNLAETRSTFDTPAAWFSMRQAGNARRQPRKKSKPWTMMGMTRICDVGMGRCLEDSGRWLDGEYDCIVWRLAVSQEGRPVFCGSLG